MRREYFSFNVSNVAWADRGDEPSKPTITITFEGEDTALREHLQRSNGESLDASEIDVTVRLLAPTGGDHADGVVAITNRVTGDYLLELNVDTNDIMRFIKAARRYGERTDDTAGYCARLAVDGDPIRVFEKRTLLVYSAEGELLRHKSLIPSGVEI